VIRVAEHPVVSLDEAEDATLADRAADGDMRSFEVLVRRYGPLMRATATRILGGSAESDDVVQDAFVVAWQQLDRLDDGAAVRGWIMRIVSNKSVDRLRARREHADIDDHDPVAPVDHSPDRVAETRSQEEALSSALSELPEPQRQCWVLKEIAGYSYEEIAEQLDLPTSTVRGLLARARKALTREMEAWR